MKSTLTLILLSFYLLSNSQNTNQELLGQLYLAHDYDKTITTANQLLAKDKNNLDYLHILGRALADNGEYQKAISPLEQSLKEDKANLWRKAWSLAYIGTCRFMLEDYEKSEIAINECLKMNTTRNATNYALNHSYLFGYNDFFNSWDIIESSHFRFHFQGMTALDQKNFIQTREAAFMKINSFFACHIPKKIDYFVWQSRKDAQNILNTDLGFARANYCIIHSHFEQTKGHEINHVISNFLSSDIRKTGFINEGTAVCFDLSNRDKKHLVTDWISKNKQKVNVKNIWSEFNRFPDELTYPLSGLFVNGLIETYGKEKFTLFFTNQTYEHAKYIYGDEIDLYIKEFETKINTN